MCKDSDDVLPSIEIGFWGVSLLTFSLVFIALGRLQTVRHDLAGLVETATRKLQGGGGGAQRVDLAHQGSPGDPDPARTSSTGMVNAGCRG